VSQSLSDRPRVRRGRSIAAVVGTAVIVALVLLPDLVRLDRYFPFAQIVALRVQAAVVVGLLAVLVVVVRRRWWPAAATALVVVGVAALMVVGRLAADDGSAAGGRPLTVLSFNVYEGTADPGPLAAAIRGNRPDLVVLTEAAGPFLEQVMPLVDDLGYLPWSAVGSDAPDLSGTVVLAAPSLGDLSARTVASDTRYPWAQVTGGALGPVQVIAVHTASPVPGWIESWPRELESLQRWCGARTPTIIVGDFNASADHSAFRSGTAGCTDAAAATGAGLVATWPSDWPRWLGAQIDHVLTVGGPAPRSVEILDLPGSDHRALLTRLVLPGA